MCTQGVITKGVIAQAVIAETVIPAMAGIHFSARLVTVQRWTPAFAGVTSDGCERLWPITERRLSSAGWKLIEVLKELAVRADHHGGARTQ